MKSNRINFSSAIKGVTLLELLLSMTIVAIITTFAVDTSNSDRLKSQAASNQLRNSVQLAFSTATYRGVDLLLCSSTDGVNCNGTDDWSNHWVIRSSDPSGPVFNTFKSPLGLTIRVSDFTDNSTLAVNSFGESIEQFPEFGSVAFCVQGSNEIIAGLVISSHGYVRTATDSDGDGTVENQDGVNLSCL